MYTSSSPGFRVHGLRELIRTCDSIERGLGKEVRGLLREVAEIPAAEARMRAPVDTGRMRDSIRAGTRRSAGVVRVSARNPRDYFAYPFVVESREAFLRPALKATEGQIVDELDDKLYGWLHGKWETGR